MPMPKVLLSRPDWAKHSRSSAVDRTRQRALQYLYARHAAVEDLIRSLESYQRARHTRRRTAGR
jgi:SOS response regulatory protein OraA/RecX